MKEQKENKGLLLFDVFLVFCLGFMAFSYRGLATKQRAQAEAFDSIRLTSNPVGRHYWPIGTKDGVLTITDLEVFQMFHSAGDDTGDEKKISTRYFTVSGQYYKHQEVGGRNQTFHYNALVLKDSRVVKLFVTTLGEDSEYFNRDSPFAEKLSPEMREVVFDLDTHLPLIEIE